MGQTGWKSELSLLDEFFGKEPKYPLATEVEHQAYEFHKQNELFKSISTNEIQEINNASSAICGSLEDGLSQLYEVNNNGFNSIVKAVENVQGELRSGFGDINRNLEKIISTLDWGFSAIIDQLTISNQKLDQIIHLLNIPDSQRQRKYHIEQGFDFLKKSKTNSFFYNKSMQHFKEALKIEDADYLSMQQLGIIHLYSIDLLDLKLSEQYFEKSIIYSSSDIGYARNKQNSSSFHFTYNPSKITAISLMHLARNYFIRENYEKAFETAQKGINTYEMVGIYYDLSKYACALDDEKGTLSFLNKAISMDRYISVKVLNELLLIKQSYVQNYLKNLGYEMIYKAQEELKKLKLIAHQNTLFKENISNIQRLVNKSTYLDSLNALENIGYELEN